MKFMILECHPGYAVAIDENGRYVKIANLSYEVGQVVENPVFMKIIRKWRSISCPTCMA